MGLLDFIKNRQAQQQSQNQAAQPKPETAREMYTQQASRDAATQRPVEQIPEADRARAAVLRAYTTQAMQEATLDVYEAVLLPALQADGVAASVA